MEVNPFFPANSILEFITYAKANPAKINMASAGNGTPHHVAGELFKMITAVDMLHVPYRSETPALTDLLGGQVQVLFGTMPALIEQFRAGNLRPLAITTACARKRYRTFHSWVISCPVTRPARGTASACQRTRPPKSSNKLNTEMNAGLADPRMVTRLNELGGMVITGSASDFGTLIADER
jgi:Tripartite tricarboxylate transporter family receptor